MNTQITSETESESEWQACAPGDLEQFVTVMKKRRKVSHMITGAEILTACLAVGLVGFFGLNSFSGSAEPPTEQVAKKVGKKCPGGLYCDEALNHAEAFVTHKLDAETTSKMKEHLAHCPGCQKKVDQLRINMHNNATAHIGPLQEESEWDAFVLTLNQ